MVASKANVGGANGTQAGRVFLIPGGRMLTTFRPTTPSGAPAPLSDELTNNSITGFGDYLADTFTYPGVLAPAAAADGQWYRFTTLGDATKDNYVRVLEEPAAPFVLRPTAGTSTAATFSIGGASGSVGILEIDLGQLLRDLRQHGRLAFPVPQALLHDNRVAQRRRQDDHGRRD